MTSPLWPITVSAAINGGATQAVTISEDSAPMTAVPTSVPCFCLSLMPAIRDCSAAGTCSV